MCPRIEKAERCLLTGWRAAGLEDSEAQTAATRAAVDRTIAAAPGALSSRVDMLVASVDAAIAKGLTEKKLLGMERQVDAILDIPIVLPPLVIGLSLLKMLLLYLRN